MRNFEVTFKVLPRATTDTSISHGPELEIAVLGLVLHISTFALESVMVGLMESHQATRCSIPGFLVINIDIEKSLMGDFCSGLRLT